MAEKIIRSSGLIKQSDGNTIYGTAIVFNSWSVDLGGFREIIRPSAVTPELLANSDIIMNVNHDSENYMMARYRNGNGTLKLTLNERGLDFEFECPDTEKGRDLMYNVRCGNLDACSFCFTLPKNGGQRWYKDAEGLKREITQFESIYDCSIVAHPAYEATSCCSRDLEDLENAKAEMEKEEIKELEKEETVEEVKEEAKIEEPTTDEVKEEDAPVVEEVKEVEPTVEEERNIENNKVINNDKKIMEKKFSIVAELRNAMETGKKINLNEIENRAYTVTDEGEDVVVTDVWNPLESLYTKNQLVNAGARVISGIKNNQQIPVMGKVSCTWEGEVDPASDGSGAISKVVLSPKRLCAFYPVSLQLLAQDSIGVENAIRKEIEKALADKLEATVLGSAAGDVNTPEGIFANTAVTTGNVADFKGITTLEEAVEENGVDIANCKYIVSPSAKASLRNMAKSAKSTQLVMEGNQIDGTEAYTTAHVPANKFIYGDFSNLVLGFWDSVQLEVVKDSAYLKNGQVVIIVNAYVDGAVIRPEAFAAGTVA